MMAPAALAQGPVIELPPIEFTIDEQLKVLLKRWTVAVEQVQKWQAVVMATEAGKEVQKWQTSAITLSQQVNALLPAQSKSVTELLTEMGFKVGKKGDNPEGESNK